MKFGVLRACIRADGQQSKKARLTQITRIKARIIPTAERIDSPASWPGCAGHDVGTAPVGQSFRRLVLHGKEVMALRAKPNREPARSAMILSRVICLGCWHLSAWRPERIDGSGSTLRQSFVGSIAREGFNADIGRCTLMHADRSRLNDLSGGVIGCAFIVFNSPGSDFWRRSMRMRWHTGCAGRDSPSHRSAASRSPMTARWSARTSWT